jgi:putative ABC transport system ATP-binding protein
VGVGTLLRRRLLTHPVALVAVATSVLMSMVVVATLQLLASAIADASVRTTLDVPGELRSVALTAGLRPGELAGVDRRVRAALAQGGSDAVVTRTSTATSSGIQGRADTDRAVVADVADLPSHAPLTAGAWPAAPGADVAPGATALEVVLPGRAAAALDATVGTRLALVDLVDGTAKPLVVVVTGTYEPTGADEGAWVDDLLNVVRGLDRPDEGRVVLDGANVTAMSDADLLAVRRGTVAYVFQSFGLVPILAARKNVGIPLRLNDINPVEREARARALAARPGLILDDEHTGQLDSETGREIMLLIARLAKEETMTTVVTTHDPVLLSIADRVLEIVDGQLVGAA